MRFIRRETLPVALVPLFIFMAGCGPVNSLNSLCTPEDNLFDVRLVGTWQPLDPAPGSDEENNRWVFERDGDAARYKLCLTSVKAKGCLKAVVRLAKIGNSMFVDFEGDTSDDETAPIKGSQGFPIIQTHMFGRIWIDKDTLRLALLSEDWVKKQLKANNVKLASVPADGGLVITAATADLRQFAQEHAEDTEAFSEKFDLQRTIK